MGRGGTTLKKPKMTLTPTWDMGHGSSDPCPCGAGPQRCVCSGLRCVFAWEPVLPGMLLTLWDPWGAFTADSWGLYDFADPPHPCSPLQTSSFSAWKHLALAHFGVLLGSTRDLLAQKTKLSGVNVSKDPEGFPRTTSPCSVKETSSSQESQPQIHSS